MNDSVRRMKNARRTNSHLYIYIYTKLIRLDIYLKRTSGVLIIVRSFILPKGSPDSKTDGYSVRAMLLIDALASVTS